MAAQPNARSRQCRRCGRSFDAPVRRGRPPVVCDDCRPAYVAEQTADRVRRWRGEVQARAREEALVREHQAHYHAHRLARLYPEAAAILASEVPPGLASDVIEQLKEGTVDLQRRTSRSADNAEE